MSTRVVFFSRLFRFSGKLKFSYPEFLYSYSGLAEFTANRKLGNTAINKKRQTPAEYCADVLRKYDYENYLATLLLPKESRSAAIAIRAFNTELSQVKDMVSSTHAGTMRIQFWKDTLDQIFQGQPPQQPIALELARILKRQKLSKLWFQRMLDSRECLLSETGHQTIEELEDYAERSVSSVYYLILQSMGITDLQCDHAASHLGKCQGITNLLRGVPFNASRGRVYLPTDVLIKHKVSQEEILQGSQEKSVTDVVYEIASLAHQHLETARSFKKDVPPAARVVFLPAVACESYLRKIQEVKFCVYDPQLQKRNGRLPLILWWCKLKRTF
ncbi:NADH dehydrogenase (ubiquinone) complex I, assembly factor 6 homolog sicily [Tachypleus tridentatus]|uniref:NADH dehydrogenase (ubiquinone) complex I, assembly factor 6 homolog sicily n=1 Tax=Tachypleus tridentatus TaxID=6853 RepID=UPI003FCF72A8